MIQSINQYDSYELLIINFILLVSHKVKTHQYSLYTHIYVSDLLCHYAGHITLSQPLLSFESQRWQILSSDFKLDLQCRPVSILIGATPDQNLAMALLNFLGIMILT